MFINDPINLNFFKNGQDLSEYRGKSSFSHRYEKYIDDLEIVEKKIIHPYDKKDINFKETGHYYLHAKNN